MRRSRLDRPKALLTFGRPWTWSCKMASAYPRSRETRPILVRCSLSRRRLRPPRLQEDQPRLPEHPLQRRERLPQPRQHLLQRLHRSPPSLEIIQVLAHLYDFQASEMIGTGRVDGRGETILSHVAIRHPHALSEIVCRRIHRKYSRKSAGESAH